MASASNESARLRTSTRDCSGAGSHAGLYPAGLFDELFEAAAFGGSVRFDKSAESSESAPYSSCVVGGRMRTATRTRPDVDRAWTVLLEDDRAPWVPTPMSSKSKGGAGDGGGRGPVPRDRHPRGFISADFSEDDDDDVVDAGVAASVRYPCLSESHGMRPSSTGGST